MNFCGLKLFDIANGEGIRTSLFVSGCRNRCEGCFQPETWNFDYGEPFDESVADKIFLAMENPSVRGLTLLGGEPMEPENQVGLLPFLKKFKERFPDKTVWLYTGYLYEQLTGKINSEKRIEITDELLSLVDIMVDGKFERSKHRLGLRFRGSENQRIIDMNKTRARGELVIWDGVALDREYNKEKI